MRFNTVALVTVLSAVPLCLVSASSSLRGGRDLSVSKEVLKQQLMLIEAELAEMEEEELQEEEEEEEEEGEVDESEEEEEEVDESEEEEEEVDESEEEEEEVDGSEEEEEEEEEPSISEEEEEEEEEPSVSEEEEEEPSISDEEEEGAIEYDGDNYVVEVPDGYDPELGDFAYPDFGHNSPHDNETPLAPIGSELPVESDSSED